jgi:hypothetical protein
VVVKVVRRSGAGWGDAGSACVVRFGVGGRNGVGRVCLSRRELTGRVERAAFDDDGAHAVMVEAGACDRFAAEGDEFEGVITQVI